MKKKEAKAMNRKKRSKELCKANEKFNGFEMQ
jgi:hypothetical protein